jgi:hypothetical protein
MLTLYHGAQRWDGPPSIQVHRKGHAEHGPGIYLTTKWETARKYSKGGGSVYRMTLSPPRTWLEQAKLSLDDVVPFIKGTLGSGKKAKEIQRSVESIAARIGGKEIPASVLVNSFVNNDVASGSRGPDLAEFLTSQGVDASHVHQGGEDWVVVFNPAIIHNVERLTPKDVDAEGFPFDLPRISRVADRWMDDLSR